MFIDVVLDFNIKELLSYMEMHVFVLRCILHGTYFLISGLAIDCPVVHKIDGGFAIRNESFHGGRVVFQCYPDYTMIGKRGRLCKSGKWLRPPPRCLGMLTTRLLNNNSAASLSS